jgi:hypothetical protein
MPCSAYRTSSRRISKASAFANGRCSHLLGDRISLADHHLAGPESVAELIDGICDDLFASAARTGRRSRLDTTVPSLYGERLQVGGRIDTWCASQQRLMLRNQSVTIGDLADYELTINDAKLRLDLPALIDETRTSLRPSSRWMTALTQGDPTEPNIAYPRLWLDFEHGGRNTIAGDIAILFWYLLGMGGWLVPRYQPDTYQRTLRLAFPPVTTPSVRSMEFDNHRHIHLRTEWSVGIGRATAIKHLVHAVENKLEPILADGNRTIMDALRPFLTCRILGVLPITTLRGDDAALCLAKLAQLQTRDLDLHDLIADLTVLETAT